jgi:hypothetical protein
MRFFKAAVAALALAGVLAQPAAALERHQFSNGQSQHGRTISMNGFWQVQSHDGGTADVAFECYANGAPFPVAMGFKECYLEGADGTRYEGLRAENPESNPASSPPTGPS